MPDKPKTPLPELELRMLGEQAGGPGNFSVRICKRRKYPRPFDFTPVLDVYQWVAMLERVKSGELRIYAIRKHR